MTIVLSVLIGILSMISYGLANAFSKPLTKKLGPAQVIFLRGIIVVAFIALVSVPDYGHFSDWQAVLATLALGIAGYLPILAFLHAIKESPLGVVAPIAGTAPLVTLLLSFLFLDVLLSPGQWLAIIAVVLASVGLSLDRKNWRQSKLLNVSSGIPYAIAAAVGWGLFYFFLVRSTEALGPWVAALVAEIGVTIAAGLHIWQKNMKFSFDDIRLPSMIWTGGLIALGTIAFTVGVNHLNVGIVAALSNSTALVSTLVGVYFFREKLRTKERVVAVVTILCIAALPLL